MMPFTGFAEEHRLDVASRAQRFFDKPHAFYADKPIFRWQAAPQGHTELLEPAIVAASKERRLTRGASRCELVFLAWPSLWSVANFWLWTLTSGCLGGPVPA